MELKKLYKNTIQVSKNLKKLAANAAVANSEELSDLNREQLSEGLLSSGDSTDDYATISYVNYKSSLGSISVPKMDFKVTGTYHKSINVKKKGTDAVFVSKDPNKLEQRFGEDLLGIAPLNAQKSADIIESDLFKEVENGLEKGIL
jgi:hypothetical protein